MPSIHRPTHALILAAGLGARLRPLTWKTPKPLMTVWGVPLIDHAIGLLKRWGVESFAINTHWRADLLEEHLSKRWPETPFRVSFEPEILGTGGALLPLRDFLEPQSTFWIFNADVLASLSPEPLLREQAESEALATLWLTSLAGPRTVATDPDRRIASFRSLNPGTEGTATFSGVHLVSGRIYRYLGTSVPASIVPAYERALAEGERVCGVEVPESYWADSGTPKTLLEIHREVRERHRRGLPGGEYYRADHEFPVDSCVAPDVRCADGAVLEDCVVGKGARIAAGVRLAHCVVGPGVTVHRNAAHTVLARPSDFEDERVNASVAVLGWVAEETTVEALDARGSDRAFFRMACPRHRAVLALHGGARPENARYAGHAMALRQAGVPVPGILAESASARWLVMEDLGDDDLLGRVRTLPPAEWPAVYGHVLDTVVKLHHHTARIARSLDMEPAFDATVYRWEHELFAEHLLRRRLDAAPSDVSAILRELEDLSHPLENATATIVHRDLQSTNVFFRDGRAHLIDFQGMRLGPPAYDLASLLCDPYVALPKPLRQELLRHYAARVPWGHQTGELFPVAAVQRLVQALGAYARLAALPGTGRFARHIAPAARILLEETDGLVGLDRLRAVVGRLTV